MTYYGGKELAASFRTVRNNTIRIAEEIPEEKYDYRPAPDCRSVAQTLTHIAVGTRLSEKIHFIERFTTLAGFDFFGFFGSIMAEEEKARTKAELVELLKGEGEKFASLLEACTDEFLGEIVQYPEGMTPPTKSRFEMLLGAKEHEMHHRGQLMLVERMLGITPHLTRQMMERVQAMAAAQKS
jgi:uncharacterized damage-inducible protein DinB